MKNDAIWKVITAIIIPVLFFLGNSVIANDQIRQREDKEIRQEMDQDRKEIAASLSNIACQLASIDTELRLSRKENTTRDNRNEARR